ncbi:DUF2520 domain-containing protein [Marinicella meishanensis]|uniref:DUF2520 domain-containing protein n=1 Tax=Marinicella meishanensis TaxID=2873263 RepID=UPI001CBF1C06
MKQPYIQWRRSASAPRSGFQPASRLANFKRKLKALIQTQPKRSLAAVVEDVRTVVVLLPDDQIESFIRNNPCLQHKRCVHFSGSLVTTLAQGIHPLMTFGAKPYDLSVYQAIPFVVDQGVEFKAVFPKFNNPVHSIQPIHKAIYHAYCVMAGNFSQMLWKHIGEALPAIDLPADLMSAYLRQNTENFINDPVHSATGPFVRGDVDTINKHLQALKGHPLGDIYQSFYDWHQLPSEQQRWQS